MTVLEDLARLPQHRRSTRLASSGGGSRRRSRIDVPLLRRSRRAAGRRPSSSLSRSDVRLTICAFRRCRDARGAASRIRGPLRTERTVVLPLFTLLFRRSARRRDVMPAYTRSTTGRVCSSSDGGLDDQRSPNCCGVDARQGHARRTTMSADVDASRRRLPTDRRFLLFAGRSDYRVRSVGTPHDRRRFRLRVQMTGQPTGIAGHDGHVVRLRLLLVL